MPFEGIINLDHLRNRFSKDLSKVNIEIDNLKKRISNKNFLERAPKEIVEDCKNKLNEANLHSHSIQKKLDMLN